MRGGRDLLHEPQLPGRRRGGRKNWARIANERPPNGLGHGRFFCELLGVSDSEWMDGSSFGDAKSFAIVLLDLVDGNGGDGICWGIHFTFAGATWHRFGASGSISSFDLLDFAMDAGDTTGRCVRLAGQLHVRRRGFGSGVDRLDVAGTELALGLLGFLRAGLDLGSNFLFLVSRFSRRTFLGECRRT